MKSDWLQRSMLLLPLCCLTACAGIGGVDLDTKEHFTHRVNEQGMTEFAFGLSWRTPSAPRNEGPQGGPGTRPNGPAGANGPSAAQPGGMLSTLSNGDKLMLEDRAAHALQKQLQQQGICTQGHEIEQVVWEADRMRLMGHCNAPSAQK